MLHRWRRGLPKRVGSMEEDVQASGLLILARLRGLKLN
jgi:hypothetical protein